VLANAAARRGEVQVGIDFDLAGQALGQNVLNLVGVSPILETGARPQCS
jgi:hypothetical protein